MNKRILLLTFGIFLMFQKSAFSQITHNQEDYVLTVKKAKEQVKLNGKADDEVWLRSVAVGDFWLKFPTDDQKSTTKTKVKAAYDDKFLYFLIEAYDSTNSYVAPSLRRDNSLRFADGVAVFLDPLNTKANGVGFSLTPNNVQAEFLFSPDGEGVEFAWDNKWFSKTERLADKYVCEIAIPFKTLRYQATKTTWGVNFIRSDRKKNEFSTWTNVPVQFNGTDLGYFGLLQFEGEIPKQKNNISLIPYVTASAYTDKENPEESKNSLGAGFDAKVAVSASLNLDLTVNPDFSNVDVDQQVTNLTRFSIFFPERRNFFLENSDLFSSYGAPPFRPFFSRRIGLDRDSAPIPIKYGARLSGNLGKTTRIGVMNLQTGSRGDYLADNFTVASVNQRIGERSLIKGYFLNRTTTAESESLGAFDKFARNSGLELNLSDKAGVNQMWLGYHESYKHELKDDNSFYQIGFGHFGANFSTFVDFAKFGANYYAEMGFVNRLETNTLTGPTYDDDELIVRAGFSQLYNENTYAIRPKDKKIIQLDFQYSNYLVWYEDGQLSDRNLEFTSALRFRNTSVFQLGAQNSFERLRFFFPLPSDRPLLPGDYNYTNFSVSYSGDQRKDFIPEVEFVTGQFYSGKINQYNLSTLVRKQPYFNATLVAQYNDIRFPEDYGEAKFWLVGPRIEATFTDKLFWTSFLQFNTQQNNFNINSRVQYRYSPMSDFFLVYSDNYFSSPFLQNKNRAIVLKFNYWLTL